MRMLPPIWLGPLTAVVARKVTYGAIERDRKARADAELVELFAEYTEADEQQKREDYLVSECRVMEADLDPDLEGNIDDAT
ncbi:TPA: hypothetical protein ACH3X1_014787 [Trebouxia sp. C0004]